VGRLGRAVVGRTTSRRGRHSLVEGELGGPGAQHRKAGLEQGAGHIIARRLYVGRGRAWQRVEAGRAEGGGERSEGGRGGSLHAASVERRGWLAQGEAVGLVFLHLIDDIVSQIRAAYFIAACELKKLEVCRRL
jgi:hypothetical protein